MSEMSQNTSSIPTQTPERRTTWSNRNVLMREGIMPTNTNPFGSSTNYRPRTNSLHKSTDQARMTESIIERKSTGFRRPNVMNDIFSWDEQFLEKSEWIPLGEGWFQTTSSANGSTTKFGLHSVIESFGNKLFMAVFEPRTIEVLRACIVTNPNYDLEVSAKIIPIQRTSGMKPLPSNFQIIFAFKSVYDYCTLCCEYDDKRWILSRFKDGEEYIISEALDLNIRSNLFYNILIQVRDTTLSIDINTFAVFTAIRFSDGMLLHGLLGVQAKGTKFAIKGWKLRGVQIDHGSGSSNSSSGSIVVSTGVGMIPTTQSNILASSREKIQSEKIPSTSVSMPTAAPKSLAELMKDKLTLSSSSSSSTSTTTIATPLKINHRTLDSLEYERISTEPPIAWGSNVGPGRSISAKRSSRLHPSTLPPPIRHIRRNTFQDSSPSKTILTASLSQSEYEPIQTISSSPEYTSTPTIKETQKSLPENSQDQIIFEAIEILRHHHDKSTIETVFRDVVQRNLGVSFDDIASLQTAKRLLNEAVILPLVMPEFFTGIREPWKGVLLFGPPGTGKTLLAKAVCSFSGSTFFNCSSSSLISKYRGESEKIVRCLFEAARLCAPSIIFLDEVDALVSSRGVEGEHEASRRMKTEIFSQMDGIASHSTQSTGISVQGKDSTDMKTSSLGVMVLATTNCPWDLDEALRRRLEKRIYIPLPDQNAREDIFRICLKNISFSDDVNPHRLAALTNGYSGADIHVVCREASMMPLRRLMVEMSPQEIQQRRFLGQLEIPKILFGDFISAISNTKPSVSSSSIAKFVSWEREYGSN